jgi:alkaline phosphatase D
MDAGWLDRALARKTTRRTFLVVAGAAAAGFAFGRARLHRAVAAPAFATDPFTLGVASGDPAPDGFVLWTRLAPDPLNGGGMPDADVEVRWQVATDDGMRNVVQEGTLFAEPEWAHSIHAEVMGLEPDRPYWYRFTAGNAASPIGRAHTAPAAGALRDQFRFAFASCQRWTDGFYGAYRDIAAQDLDLVVHLGDYIYEGRITNGVGPRKPDLSAEVRAEPTTLAGYRLRYTLYKLDPDLQAAHRQSPWVLTWDDHEVVNDYANDNAPPRRDPQEFLRRRAAAYRAYYEHQPLRWGTIPAGPFAQLYRRLAFGDLLVFNVLDTRQYRSFPTGRCSTDEHAANNGYCAASLDTERTIMGTAQKRWLLDGLAATTARWPVIANQVFFSRRNLNPTTAKPSYGDTGDKWDGYAAERDEVVRTMAAIGAQKPFNPVIITGDIHSNWVYDIKADWDRPDGATVGTEFVGTSISSEGDTRGNPIIQCGGTAANPHQHFYNDSRGYVLCTATPDRWQTDYRAVASVSDATAPATTIATFVVEQGEPGAQQDGACPAAP